MQRLENARRHRQARRRGEKHEQDAGATETRGAAREARGPGEQAADTFFEELRRGTQRRRRCCGIAAREGARRATRTRDSARSAGCAPLAIASSSADSSVADSHSSSIRRPEENSGKRIRSALQHQALHVVSGMPAGRPRARPWRRPDWRRSRRAPSSRMNSLGRRDPARATIGAAVSTRYTGAIDAVERYGLGPARPDADDAIGREESRDHAPDAPAGEHEPHESAGPKSEARHFRRLRRLEQEVRPATRSPKLASTPAKVGKRRNPRSRRARVAARIPAIRESRTRQGREDEGAEPARVPDAERREETEELRAAP